MGRSQEYSVCYGIAIPILVITRRHLIFRLLSKEVKQLLKSPIDRSAKVVYVYFELHAQLVRACSCEANSMVHEITASLHTMNTQANFAGLKSSRTKCVMGDSSSFWMVSRWY